MRMSQSRSVRFFKLLLIGAMIAFGPIKPAPAQPVPAEAVEELRLLLKAPATDVSRRDHAVKEQLRLLDSINDLRRALGLAEWRDEDAADEQVAAVDQHNRALVAERFEQAVRDVLGQRDATSQLAALSLLGQMGSTVRAVGTRKSYASTFTPDLVALVKKGEPRVREAAARTLGLIHPEPKTAAAALGGLLGAREASLRRAAADGLLNLVRVESQLAGRSRMSDRVEATRADLVNTTSAVAALAGRALRDADAGVRRQSVETLHLAADALRKQVLSNRLADDPNEPDSYRRQVEAERKELMPLIRALREQGSALTRALGDKDADVRLIARQTLEDMTAPQIQLLERAAAVALNAPKGSAVELRPSQFISPEALQDSLLEGLHGTVQALAAGLKDGDVRARRGAIDVLETLGPASASAGPALVRALRDPDQFVRWAAARTLGKISPVEAATAVPALGSLLADLDLDVRLAAVIALERYGPAAQPALPELIRAMRATDAELRVAAMRAVVAVGGTQTQAAISVLTEALADSDSRVRLMAAQVLGRFGPGARSAVDALKQALQDSDLEVQKAAGEALLNIKRQTHKK
jgi:hypothetical protein